MVVTRRKRKESTDVSIYLNNKPLEQVNNIKYLGIIIDSKLNFREHIIQTSRKCTTLIHVLPKSAKLSWGLKHKVLDTIYKAAILPLMLYGALVWIGAMEKKCNKTIYSRVQRLMNIKIAKAYRTTSNEALCTLTGITPIEIKAEETANVYRITRDRKNHQLDHEIELKDWTHPADTVTISEQNEANEHTIEIITEGSKNEHGFGSGTVIYVQNMLTHQMKHKLHDKCSNNQAEQMAIVKALQAIETIKINNTPRTIKIHTDSRITLESVKNTKNRNHLIEEIRKKTALEKENWNIEYAWIKAHAGNYGNELADRLAKEAARNSDISYNKFPKSEIERQEREKSIQKWQKQWENSTKGSVTKEFFPNIKDRLKMKINLTPNFTAMITAHGKTRSYLYRFKIIESSECPCANGNKTVDHLIYEYNKPNNEREKMIAHISKEDNWPIRKSELVKKYLKQFIHFTNSTDYEKL